jgi:hypothetical protein
MRQPDAVTPIIGARVVDGVVNAIAERWILSTRTKETN